LAGACRSDVVQSVHGYGHFVLNLPLGHWIVRRQDVEIWQGLSMSAAVLRYRQQRSCFAEETNLGPAPTSKRNPI
jgi:hypothetical protein